jgi:hypothetical protein
MSFNPEDDENRSPCSFFCLWTHLHGWRHFALAKNKIYWVIWIIILFLAIVMGFFGIHQSIKEYSTGKTSIWSEYKFIEDGRFPSVTICKATPGIPTGAPNMCNELGVSVMWRNTDLASTNVKMMNSITDYGLCCNVNLTLTDSNKKELEPKVGVMQGMNIIAYPGLNENGVYMAYHAPGDVPQMNVKGNFIPEGTDNAVDLKIYSMRSGAWCYGETEVDRPKLSHGFGTRYSLNNCVYDNCMDAIKTTCNCDKLVNCSSTEQWTCASKILMDPFTKRDTPLDCRSACETDAYEAKISSAKLMKDPKLCGNWLTALKAVCTSSQSTVETGYGSLCSQANAVSCPADTIFTNRPVLQTFAKEKLVSMNLYSKDFYMAVHWTYFVNTFAGLVAKIGGILVVYLGFSFMSIPELLYFCFCSRGGGCICSPILKNCA